MWTAGMGGAGGKKWEVVIPKRVLVRAEKVLAAYFKVCVLENLKVLSTVSLT